MSWTDVAVQAVQDVWTTGGWQANALLAVFISFFAVSIAYMVAVAFDLPNLKKWARSEFLQAAVSAILAIGLVFALSGASDSLLGIMLGKTQAVVTILEEPGNPLERLPVEFKGGDPFLVTFYYLGCAGENCRASGQQRDYGALGCMKEMYLRLYRLNFLVEMVEKSNFALGGVYEINAWMLSVFVNAIHFLLQNISFLFIAVYFQKALLVFIKSTMLAYFLPVGIVLRAFPLTRGAGALLMGIAIGLYFFYPLAFTLVLAANAGQLQGGNALGSAACVAYETLGVEQGDIPEVKDSYGGWTPFAKAVLWVVGKLGNVADSIAGVQGMMPFMVHELFIYPLVALTITFTIIKGLSDLFGADVAELARGLIKLI